MTRPPQDDADERRIRELVTTMTAHPSDIFLNLLRQLWGEATEAAAKKCDAQKVKTAFGVSEGVVEAYDNACQDCATAIRGKP